MRTDSQMGIHHSLRSFDLGVHASQHAIVADSNALDRALNPNFLRHAISSFWKGVTNLGNVPRRCSLRVAARSKDKSRHKRGQENHIEQSIPNHSSPLTKTNHAIFIFFPENY